MSDLEVNDETSDAMNDKASTTKSTASGSPSDLVQRRGNQEFIAGVPIARTGIGRLLEEQTAIDFVGRRKFGAIFSAILLIATVVSLFTQGLNLGIDFTGGVSWEMPAEHLTVDDAKAVLLENGYNPDEARIQVRQLANLQADSATASDTTSATATATGTDSGSATGTATDSSTATTVPAGPDTSPGEGDGSSIKVQVAEGTDQVGQELRSKFAEAAGVKVDEVNVDLVSSSWGAEITRKALIALLVFLALVSLFISFRFEWRMALAAILAMIHDVLISIGIYSIFQFLVTPPTVIAFLTILGYSLYDTIVVFDRIRENEARFSGQKPPFDDIVNVSMNQVLMRSLATSFSSVVPVISLLLVGAGLMGEGTLAEFALALLIGMLTGAYSSIFVAAPLLGILKQRDPVWAARGNQRTTGEALRAMVITGDIGVRRANKVAGSAVASSAAAMSSGQGAVKATTAALTHPPRPRKKKRRQ